MFPSSLDLPLAVLQWFIFFLLVSRAVGRAWFNMHSTFFYVLGGCGWAAWAGDAKGLVSDIEKGAGVG